MSRADASARERVPTYADLVDRLFPRLSGGIRWGLDRTRALLASVGDPQRSFPCLHVAGTNGKGTVCHMVEEALRLSGLRTGLYTSPHLVEFRERIRLDGEPIEEDALLEAAALLWGEIEATGATFFEATTAIGLLAMARAEVDVAVVEVGLGGRLDATNAIEPEVCAITRVDMDHATYLGDSLVRVAGEKAGIFKAGVPAVVAGGQEPEAMAALRARARDVGAPLTLARPEARSGALGRPRWFAATGTLGEVPLAPALRGAHHLDNAAVAAHVLAALGPALRPSAEAAARGIARAAPPGRFQRLRARGVDWILDVAHNPAGAVALERTLAATAPRRPVIAVVGIVADKDWRAMLAALAPGVDRLVLTTAPGVPEERRWDPAAAGAEVGELGLVAPDFGSALDEAVRLAGRGPGGRAPRLSQVGTVVVMGSFHTVGGALRWLEDAPSD
ncbi:MAG TPA: cyanophycin synthetase [Longimicrobiales bacterium]|nr:cyanophycin synthetase [Longimicrobiales bacterium]